MIFLADRESFAGVAWEDELRLAAAAQIEVKGATVYREAFGSDVAAALVRELVIVRRALTAERNFPDATERELCREIAQQFPEMLNEWTWLNPVGLTPDEFLALASWSED